MEPTEIEREFLQAIREASPEDCKTIVSALYALEGREDGSGELTSLGLLTGAINDALMINGILKKKKKKIYS